MRTFAAIFFSVLLVASCKKENPIDPSVPLSERIVGSWQVTAIQYNGIAPSPIDSTQTILFSGSGKNVSGHFNFDGDTNLGEFEITFIGEVDLGLASPVTFPVEMTRSGNYTIIDNDKIVQMTNFAGDSTYNWEVRENQANKQKWFVEMMYDFGVGSMPPFPIYVEAVLER